MSILSNELDELTEKLSDPNLNEEQKEEMKKEIEDKKADHKNKEELLTSSRSEIKEYEKQLEELEKNQEELMHKKVELHMQQSEVDQELTKKDQEKQEARVKLDGANYYIDELETDPRIFKLNHMLDELEQAKKP